MSETSSQTTDSAGLMRTADGTLADKSPSTETSSTTTNNQTEQSTQNTSQESKTKTEDGKSFLTEGDKSTEVKPEPKLDKDGKPIEPSKGAPETYADFKLPDGFKLSDEMKTDVTGMFKSWGLNQDQAQQAIDYYTKQTADIANAPYQHYLETRKGWRDEIASDPVIGSKQAAVKAEIGRAINSLGDPKMVADFRQALDITGIGDHPAFVRAFYAFSQRLNEGKPVAPRGPSPLGQTDPSRGDAKPSAAQAMYPNLPTNQRA
jgi:hypothetical protein